MILLIKDIFIAIIVGFIFITGVNSEYGQHVLPTFGYTGVTLVFLCVVQFNIWATNKLYKNLMS